MFLLLLLLLLGSLGQCRRWCLSLCLALAAKTAKTLDKASPGADSAGLEFVTEHGDDLGRRAGSRGVSKLVKCLYATLRVGFSIGGVVDIMEC